ncbi:GNAT family N-acetyltransferase [Rhodoblastus acidophilus]|uniref:L-ornithine N(alpha)-acyltransferase n=1 Tax=Candidatus Rhodoblastus alkanivorans TaxID=2954117 RepID=A0ABS9Z1U0_9HYPH|nr:GNAT family N-acyltransferase [Candidatus Rhodoblastus alkanivorans]MCI4678092.1 GNAT family N-acetyltransferase [Candidatus Rhodoblastus alkanivorans]MCI4681567.1 GNAT family N-acetyltransferase [Candidatus Rhodoblastus alkanivorans]MDI4642615.1 GNAT family N-acetyltransferase [Rhodoblastus acidophilus]
MNGLAVIAGFSSRFPFLPKKPPNRTARKFHSFPGLRPRSCHSGLGPSLGWSGSLELRLATRKSEIRKAQRLRYRVFFQEGGATADATAALVRRDLCRFDKVCDHLLVIDHATRNRFGKAKPKVVGAYRLLRQEVAQKHFGFYSAQEFDIGPLLARHPNSRFLELGRSCVLAEYRGKKTIEMLWRGIWAYVKHHRIDAMIGCASLEGSDPSRLASQLGFLHHFAKARPEWIVRPLPERFIAMDSLPRAAVDPKRALAALPPLIKGYMRVGAKFGDGAVVDRQFGVTDVFVVMPIAEIEGRYIEYFGGPEDFTRGAS